MKTKEQTLALLIKRIDSKFKTRVEAAAYFDISPPYLCNILAGRVNKSIAVKLLDFIEHKEVIGYEKNNR